MEVETPYEVDQLVNISFFTEIRGAPGKLAVTPKLHMSAAVSHGISRWTSGARKRPVPVGVPCLAMSEAMETAPPQSANWISENRFSPTP